MAHKGSVAKVIDATSGIGPGTGLCVDGVWTVRLR